MASVVERAKEKAQALRGVSGEVILSASKERLLAMKLIARKQSRNTRAYYLIKRRKYQRWYGSLGLVTHAHVVLLDDEHSHIGVSKMEVGRLFEELGDDENIAQGHLG